MSTPRDEQDPHDSEALPMWSLPEMRYQTPYVWFIFVSSLDIMLTWVIVLNRDGEEVNPVAKLVIDSWGLPGAIGFKFALTLFVIIACEVIGRKRDLTGRALITFAIVLSSSPVVWSIYLLVVDWLNPAPV